jgi:hypothetical protein
MDIVPSSLAKHDYQLVAKVGLSVGVSGLVGVLFVLWVIGDRSANGYGEIISAVGCLVWSWCPLPV